MNLLDGRPDVAVDGASGAAAVAESDLVSRLRSGDAAAFEHVVRGHGGRMLAVCRRMLGSEEDAEEAVQRAFVGAFRSIARFDGRSRLGTWLHRIAMNEALMLLRSRRRRDERSIEELLPAFEDDGHRRGASRDWSVPAEALLEREETRVMVRAAIDRLPDDHRLVLLLRDIEELDTEETAAYLGISPGAVKTRLHRARMALREQLAAAMA